MIKPMKKIAFITGANRGIGYETARQLARAGVYPIIGSRDLNLGIKAAKALNQEGLECEALEIDVENPSHISSVKQYLENKFAKLDILINNAGIFMKGDALPTATEEAILRKTMEVNFYAPVRLTMALLPLLEKSSGARIVNVSSILGSLTKNSHGGGGNFAYDTSKTALNSFTIHLAQELRDTNIKVNSIHPGWVQTDMGGENATLPVVEGAKTSVRLALVDENGPTGGYFHLNQTLPW